MTGKTKGIMKFTALFVSAALILALALTIPRLHTGGSGTEETLMAGEQAPSGKVLLTEGEGNGICLTSAEIALDDFEAYGVSPMAENAFTVSATVKVAGGVSPKEYQYVDFALSWDGEDGGPIEGEYLEMQTTDTTATVSVLKGFSTPIKLTASSRLDANKSSQITLGYAKALSGFQIETATKLIMDGYSDEAHTSSHEHDWYTVHTISESGTSIPLHLANVMTHANTMPSGAGSWEAEVFSAKGAVWDDVGTVENSVTDISVSCKYTDSFWKAFQNNEGLLTRDVVYTLPNKWVSQYDLLLNMFKTTSTDGEYAYRFLGRNATTMPDRHDCENVLSPLDSAENPIEVTLTVTLQYGNPVTYTFYLDVEVEPYAVENVEMNAGSGEHIFTQDDLKK